MSISMYRILSKGCHETAQRGYRTAALSIFHQVIVQAGVAVRAGSLAQFGVRITRFGLSGLDWVEQEASG